MDQFSTLTEQEFTTFAMTHPAGNFLETPEMKHLLERRGWHCEYVGVKREGQLIAACIPVSYTHLTLPTKRIV